MGTVCFAGVEVCDKCMLELHIGGFAHYSCCRCNHLGVVVAGGVVAGNRRCKEPSFQGTNHCRGASLQGEGRLCTASSLLATLHCLKNLT